MGPYKKIRMVFPLFIVSLWYYQIIDRLKLPHLLFIGNRQWQSKTCNKTMTKRPFQQTNTVNIIQYTKVLVLKLCRLLPVFLSMPCIDQNFYLILFKPLFEKSFLSKLFLNLYSLQITSVSLPFCLFTIVIFNGRQYWPKYFL